MFWVWSLVLTLHSADPCRPSVLCRLRLVVFPPPFLIGFWIGFWIDPSGVLVDRKLSKL